MWILTGFADEISPDLDLQLQVLASEGIRHLELRAVWETNVLDLSDAEIEHVRRQLSERSMRVSAIGSPIGKVAIDDDFDAHLARFRRAIWCARQLETEYIRIFSFFIPDKEYDRHRSTVLDRLNRFTEEAAKANVILLHENEKGIYGDLPERCLDIVEHVNSPHLRLVWDAANFVQCGVQSPHDAGYEMLRPHIQYVHIKDALYGSGLNVPAGKGDGQIAKTLLALRESGFEGFFSIEPHLQDAGVFSGFSGPDLFKKATQAFKGLAGQIGVELT